MDFEKLSKEKQPNNVEIYNYTEKIQEIDEKIKEIPLEEEDLEHRKQARKISNLQEWREEKRKIIDKYKNLLEEKNNIIRELFNSKKLEVKEVYPKQEPTKENNYLNYRSDFDYIATTESGSYGIFNETGEEIISPKYDNIKNIEDERMGIADHLFSIEMEKDGLKSEVNLEALKEYKRSQNEQEIIDKHKITEESDDKLIHQVMLGEASGFPSEAAFGIIQKLLGDQTKVKAINEKTKDKDIADIGGGDLTLQTATQLLGFGYHGRTKNHIDFKKFIPCDPFSKEYNLGDAKKWLEEEGYNFDDYIDPKIAYAEENPDHDLDALSFLNKRETGDCNIMLNNIDAFVVNNPDYLRRVGQEVFRVTPKDGVFITGHALIIEGQAAVLFPYRIKSGNLATTYSKEPFTLPETEEE